jgi:membrane protein implicated in regulation of membrane protease activity
VFEIPVSDFIFLMCALVAGGLLLITVLLDDILGGLFDLDIGGTSLMPLLLAFVAMFGIGGLFASQVMDLDGAAATVVGVISGTIGAAMAFGMFTFLRKSVTPNPFSIQDLVGTDAYVSVAIPKTEWGTISLEAEGQTHEFRATAAMDIPRGQTVHITGVAGTGLIVEPSAGTSAEAPTASDDTKAPDKDVNKNP